MKNKSIFFSVFLFQIFIPLFFIFSFGIFFILNDYLIKPVSNYSLEILYTANITTGQSVTAIQTLTTTYAGWYVFFDYMFLGFFIGFFISTLLSSYGINKNGWFSFYGLLTIGYLLLALLIYFSSQISDWLMSEIFFTIINDSFSAPIIYFFWNNAIPIIFIWFTILVFIATIDTDKYMFWKPKEINTTGYPTLDSTKYNEGDLTQ